MGAGGKTAPEPVAAMMAVASAEAQTAAGMEAETVLPVETAPKSAATMVAVQALKRIQQQIGTVAETEIEGAAPG